MTGNWEDLIISTFVEKKKCLKNILTLLPSEFKNAKLISTYFVDGSPISVKKGILQHTANSCCFNRITI